MKNKKNMKEVLKSAFVGTLLAGMVAPHVLCAQDATAEKSSGKIMVQPVSGAVEKSINTNPEVQASWHAFMDVYEEQGVARGGYFPTLDATADIGREWRWRDGSRTEDFWRKGIRLEVRQMLFDGFYTNSQVCRLKRSSQARYFEFLQSLESAGLEGLRAYADVMRYRDLVDMAHQNYDYHQEIYEQISKRVQSGVGAKVNLEQIEGRLALASSNLMTEQSNLHDVSARYQRIVGELPPDHVEDFSVDITGLPSTVGEALPLAYQQNPSFLATLADIEASEQAVRVQQSKFYPRFDIRAYHDWSWDEDGIDVYEREAAVELLMTYNIFNGGSDLAAVKQYKMKKLRSMDIRERVRREVRQTLEIAYNDKSVLAYQVEYLDQHRENVAKVRVAYRDQFNIGKRTLLDLLDTENEYFQAQRAYTNAFYDLKIADARALAGMGRLLQSIGVVREDLPTQEDLELCAVPVAAVDSSSSGSELTQPVSAVPMDK